MKITVGTKVQKVGDGLYFKDGETGEVTELHTQKYFQVQINNIKKWIHLNSVKILDVSR